MKLRPYLPFLFAGAGAVPGSFLRLAGIPLDPVPMALVSGLAILSASLLLIWACDAAQADICQALALAVVALLAVLPEYSVDMYFTWHAGLNPDSEYAHYTIANMTGANRLLIGVAWGAIALLYWVRHRGPVAVNQERQLELTFVALATAYALLIPLKRSLAWYDGLVFLGLYGWYIVLASRRSCTESAAEGPAVLLVGLPTTPRRIGTVLLFSFAAAAIFANAKPFCEGLIGTGKLWLVNEFLLVQWLAPIASEAPEFTVALIFAWRGQGSLALGSLLSAKLNQWTLLVGMIPGVFGFAHQSFDHPMPLSALQLQEILLTGAQSLLGVVMLASLRLSVSSALLLFGLFTGQLVLPHFLNSSNLNLGIRADQVHPLFTLFYLIIVLALILHRPSEILSLARALLTPSSWSRISPSHPSAAEVDMVAGHSCSRAEEPLTPRCLKCPWRLGGLRAVNSRSG
jgi:cation:H+ antiporter